MKTGRKAIPYSNILVLLGSAVICVALLEALFLMTENFDYYGGAVYTMDCPDGFNNKTPFVHQDSDIPGLSYELTPNISVIWQKANITTNSRGQRGREYAVPKPEGVYRIVAVGDSVTFGAGIDYEDTFLSRLEGKLNKNSTLKYEVINGGVSAYNLYQKYRILETRLLVYEPDMVLVNFVQDDYGPANQLKRSVACTEGDMQNDDPHDLLSLNMPKIFPLPQGFDRMLIRKSAFYRFLNINTYNILSRIDPMRHPPEIYKIIGGVGSGQYNKESIDSFARLSASNNFTIVVVSFPSLINDDSRNDRWILNYPIDQYNMKVIDLYRELKLRNVDLASMKQVENDYAHPNVDGSRVIGEILYDELSPIAR